MVKQTSAWRGSSYLAGRQGFEAARSEPQPEEPEIAFAVRIATDLDNTVLAIQGPPGAGKTHTAALMICELVRSGARVGVTAVSHKVIRNLLDMTVKLANEAGIQMTCVHKVGDKSDSPSAIEETTKQCRGRWGDSADGRANVVGGTAWLWARPEAKGICDVLFVDEAGQLSLANALAVSQAAKSVVLLGDPSQLEQPQQGSHPDGADLSAMEHILGAHQTIPAERGIFLPETWRLAPSISAFTSEVFYEGRLRSRDGLEKQTLVATSPFDGAGLWVVSVEHDGNQNSSPEEVDAVDRIVAKLLHGNASWIDREGVTRPMTSQDILVVAPYNAHVALLGERLASRGIRVGTVDRFRGRKRRWSSIRWRHLHLKMRRAEWNSCTASTGLTSRRREHAVHASSLRTRDSLSLSARAHDKCNSPMPFAAMSNLLGLYS